MPRTDAESVAAIIEVDVSVDLDPFILVANELVTECCADAGYSDSRLELIERWLAAHFYTNRDPRAVSERADEIAETKQSKVDLGLNTSHYGQHAMLLDTAGGLASLNASITQARRKVIASVTWLGTKPCETVESLEEDCVEQPFYVQP